MLEALLARLEALIAQATPADLAPILDAIVRVEALRVEAFTRAVLEKLTAEERATLDGLLAKVRG